MLFGTFGESRANKRARGATWQVGPSSVGTRVRTESHYPAPDSDRPQSLTVSGTVSHVVLTAANRIEASLTLAQQ